MIVRISRKELEKKIRFFLKMKIPFKKLSTTERTIIHAEGRWGSWMNRESSFRAAELHFIKSVKEFILKHGTYKKVRNYFKKEGSTGKIKYFYYNKNTSPGQTIEGVTEIDLKNAYWHTAYTLPKDGTTLFSEEIYKKGLTVSKKSRLAAIGSLAKVVSVWEFNGEKEIKHPPEKSETTEYLWHTICNKIGKIMAKGSKVAKNDFLFFWVDAIFVKNESAKEVAELFKKHGYEVSIYPCEWVKFDDNKITVKSSQKGKWVKRIKEEPFERDGKQLVKKVRFKEWKDERVFPYKIAMNDKEIMNLVNE